MFNFACSPCGIGQASAPNLLKALCGASTSLEMWRFVFCSKLNGKNLSLFQVYLFLLFKRLFCEHLRAIKYIGLLSFLGKIIV